MRLVVIPISRTSSRRAFLYCLPTKPAAGAPEVKPTIQERVVSKASSTWRSFEQSDTSWKKKLVAWGNKMVDTIDYREHSLKSVMSIAAYDRHHPAETNSSRNVTISHPARASTGKDILLAEVRRLAAEGAPRHRSKMISAIVLSPFTIPFMLIPIVPNIPFFYLAFRAWSHMRAMQGAQHLQLLLKENRLDFAASEKLDEIYDSAGSADAGRVNKLLQPKTPDLATELNRAIRQVRKLEESDSEQEIDLASSRSTLVDEVQKAVKDANAASAGIDADAPTPTQPRADPISAEQGTIADGERAKTAADVQADGTKAAISRDVAGSDVSGKVSAAEQQRNKTRARIGLHK
ncbi:hypothetical protein PYCC9005_004376 [Savitreella phatthalungensis]